MSWVCVTVCLGKERAEANRWTHRAAVPRDCVWCPAVPPVNPPVSQPVAATQGWARRDGAPSFRRFFQIANARARARLARFDRGTHSRLGQPGTDSSSAIRTGRPFSPCADLTTGSTARTGNSLPFSCCGVGTCWMDDLDLLSRGVPSLPAAPTFRSLRFGIFLPFASLKIALHRACLPLRFALSVPSALPTRA